MSVEMVKTEESSQQTPMVCCIAYENYYGGKYPFGYVFSQEAAKIIKNSDLFNGKLESSDGRHSTLVKLEGASGFIKYQLPWAHGVIYVGVENGINSNWNRTKHLKVMATLDQLGWTENLKVVKLIHW